MKLAAAAAGICLMMSATVQASVYFETGGKAYLFTMHDGGMKRTTCPPGTINPTVATCAEDRREAAATAIFAAVTPLFGGKLDHYNKVAREWSVEIRRVEVKIIELLSTAPGDPGDLPDQVRDLSMTLEKLEARAVDTDEQIALLEDRLRDGPDADASAQLAERREAKRQIDEERAAVGARLADLRHRLISVLSDFYDPATFQLVTDQRADAIEAYEESLRQAAKEQARRVACERTYAYFADVGFVFRFRSHDSNGRPAELETVAAVHAEHNRAYLSSYEVAIHPTDPHTAFCPGGTNSFCGIRAGFKVPVEARLAGVTCKIVGAVSPCYQLQLFKTVDNDGILSVDGDEAQWTVEDDPSPLWQQQALGHWSVVGRCQFVSGPDQHHYPGRLDCTATLREP